jgi:hypothetical protein
LAKTARRIRTKAEPKPIVSPLMIGVVMSIAILLVGGLIVLGNLGNQPTSAVDINQFPALGPVNAPVTMIDYSDYG